MKSIVSISIVLSFLILSSLNLNAQQKSVAVDSLIVAAVKKDVWIPFMESYRDLDFKKLESIHSPNITRVGINMNQIETGSDYLKNLNAFFEQIKGLNYEMEIKFSIISSATTKDKVYQTGYYTIGLRADESSPFQSTGYSSFSVMSTKENGTWKISFDADQQVKITKEEFEKAGVIYKL